MALIKAAIARVEARHEILETARFSVRICKLFPRRARESTARAIKRPDFILNIFAGALLPLLARKMKKKNASYPLSTSVFLEAEKGGGEEIGGLLSDEKKLYARVIPTKVKITADDYRELSSWNRKRENVPRARPGSMREPKRLIRCQMLSETV